MLLEAHGNNNYELIETLAKEIWLEHYTPIIGIDQVNYMLAKFQSVQAIKKQIINDNYIYFLIKGHEKFIGYAGIQLRNNELFLSKFYVKSSYQGQGHGKQTMLFIESLAKEKGYNKISLTVNKNNLNAINAYEKMRFLKAGSIVQDIGNGFLMDDYIMEKTLQPTVLNLSHYL